MSAQEFKPGDRVRCIETWTTHVIDSGDEFTVEDVDPTTRNGLEVFVQDEWVPARYFEKVEPEATPVEAVLRIIHLDRDDFPACGAGEQMRKVGEPDHTTATKHYFLEWHLGTRSEPGADVCADCALIATEPEDKDDLYVEPEPLRKGDAVLVWVTVDGRVDSDGDVRLKPAFFGEVDPTMEHFYSRSDAIVRPDAGQVPPWVKPSRCTSLREYDGGVLKRCINDASYVGHHFDGRVSWTDAEAYGHVGVSS